MKNITPVNCEFVSVLLYARITKYLGHNVSGSISLMSHNNRIAKIRESENTSLLTVTCQLDPRLISSPWAWR